MVDAKADVHIKATWRTKQGFVLGRPAPVAVAGRFILGIRLRFNDHAPEQAAVVLAFHQPATHQIGGHDLGWTAEEGLGQGWEILGDGQGGYGSGKKTCLSLEQHS